jgi:uncharacterized membrane protein
MLKDRTPIRIVVGVIAIGIGLLWIGQGLGLVAWPESSPMIGRGTYAWWGAALVAIGLALIKMAMRR